MIWFDLQIHIHYILIYSNSYNVIRIATYTTIGHDTRFIAYSEQIAYQSSCEVQIDT